ncbi:MAG: hypothetical protein ACI39H_03585 [Lachnospiraceae bacterium]
MNAKKPMKNMMKRLPATVLTLALLFCLLPPSSVQAATTSKSITMYVGEVFNYTDYSTVKSTSSSKKTVVSVKKDSSNPKYAIFTAKKAGSATLTIKTKNGTTKIKVTVKKLSMTVSMKDLGNGYIYVSVKNSTKQVFEDVTVNYSLVDADGNEVKSDDKKIYSVLPGKTSYGTIYYNNYSYSVDIANSKASVTEVDRYPNRTYKDISSKIKTTVSEEAGEDTMVVSITSKNNYTDYAHVYNFILIYNAENQVIGCENRSTYLKSKASDTTSLTLYINLYPGYDHYKVITRSYSSKF